MRKVLRKKNQERKMKGREKRGKVKDQPRMCNIRMLEFQKGEQRKQRGEIIKGIIHRNVLELKEFPPNGSSVCPVHGEKDPH